MYARARSTAAIAGLCLVVGLAGCTPGEVPGQTPTPKPGQPTAVATPPETAQERQIRIDQRAAIDAYRQADQEIARLGMAGGAKSAPPRLRAVASGSFLEFTMSSLNKARTQKLRTTGAGTIVSASAQGWSELEIPLKVCEDLTQVRVVNQKGKDVTPPGERRYLQKYTVRMVDSTWKVDEVSSTPVRSFDDYDCRS